MTLQPVADIPARYPFADIEKRLGGGTVDETAHRLDLPLAEVRRMRTAGVTPAEAEEIATTLELTVEQIWPDVEQDLPDGFEWVEAPPRLGRKNFDWAPLLQPLIAHPNRWARVKRYKSTTGAGKPAKDIREGRSGMPGRWNAVRRSSTPGTSDLYVCYLGPAEP